KDTANTSRSGLYTVRRGDSISRIAKRLKVKRADLMEANNLTPNSILRPGQTLKLPGAKVVDEESVVEEKIVDKKQDEQKVIEKSPETPKSDSSDDALIRDLENDVAKNPPAKNNGAAETVDAAAKTADIPENGTPVEVSQEIHIDDYCKQHSINKAEMLKLNPKLNENSILKPNTVFVIP
ncbi:MAG: LysM peptidoglycan-binding domain-containing protein, partial [Lentisphaeria bacterium]|nr:LysM peptidoglycan-binding domain-containing protein [Lentisphaeria bacterium]